MGEPATNYIPVEIYQRFRQQAVRDWVVGLVVVLIWAAAIVAAPLLKAYGFLAVSGPLYHFYSLMCHQIPDRSFHVAGEQFGVCSRCFGVYFGLVVGFAVYPLWRPIDEIEPLGRIWLFMSLVPAGIDWSLTIFGIWENTHLTRFVSGLILGVACATYIVPAIVEISRNLTIRKLRQLN